MQKEPEDDIFVWMANITASLRNTVTSFKWRRDFPEDYEVYKRGLLHKNQDSAKEHAEAMIHAIGGVVNFDGEEFRRGLK